MKKFMDENFLLTTKTAAELYHGYAEDQPIFDYHNHLSPKDIAEHRRFHNLTELWLETDHYKWRALRACGVEERLVSGDAPDYDKFLAWAETVPRLVGSPLYHWTHLELQRYFGIYDVLSPETAPKIWDRTREMMESPGFDAVSLLEKMKVRVLCTTDGPADSLEWHRKIAGDSSIHFKVLPAFRPDKYLSGSPRAVKENSARLCEKYDTDNIKTALGRALDYFCDMGAVVTDHGFSRFDYGQDDRLTGLLDFLGGEYYRHGVVMQLHLGPVRNNSPRLMKLIGPDAGGDSVGMCTSPFAISAFLAKLEAADSLPRTILYNLNPNDNMMLSTMAGNFAPRVQYGAAWWFNDHIRGIRAQLDELMETNSLASSVGMLTDSRSFTSFVRHEYFRRILCGRLGELAEEGLYPKNLKTLGKIVSDVCYNNAVKFFSGE
ncbi:MAG: glucuronate isomerase [Candidatus Limivicinus sp.]|jgi:glucuronate isomerase